MLVVQEQSTTTAYVDIADESQPSSSHMFAVTNVHYHKHVEGQTDSGDAVDGQKVEATSSVCFPSSSRSPPARDEAPLPKAVQTLRSRHTRIRSASSAATPREKTLYSSPLRTRSSSTSTSELPFYKPHLSNTMPSSRATAARAQPILSLDKEAEETIGSFSPTSCPRRYLHEILEASKPPSRLRFNSLRAFSPKLPWAVNTAASEIQSSGSSGSRTPTSSDSDDEQSHTPNLPSICRTPSSYSESDYFPTAPSSVGVITPVHSNPSSPVIQHRPLALRPRVESKPILEALEDASKFRVRTACAHCRRAGSNFPCCPRCGEMWCSRECRIQATGGKRHVCRRP